jgi:hypothetical protein
VFEKLGRLGHSFRMFNVLVTLVGKFDILFTCVQNWDVLVTFVRTLDILVTCVTNWDV